MSGNKVRSDPRTNGEIRQLRWLWVAWAAVIIVTVGALVALALLAP
jgi:hypothetical protein